MSPETLIKGKSGVNTDQGSTAGIIVRVADVLSTPETAKKTYEIYRFGLGGDCQLYGIGLEEIEKWFPKGQKYQIFAGKSVHVPASTIPDTGRLEFRYGRNDSISLIDPSDTSTRNLAASTPFDYKKYREDPVGDIGFELVKDMLRLENATNDTEREAILERLTYVPSDRFYLKELFKLYTHFPDGFDLWTNLAETRVMKPAEFKRLQETIAARKKNTLDPYK